MEITRRLQALFFGLWRVAAVGLIAIGVSGLLAGGLGAAFGKTFVSGDGPGVAYAPDRCAEFQEYYPAPTCEAAATLHHFDEVVSYRVAAGVLGLLAVAALAAIARFRPALVRDAGLDPAVVPAVGAVLFGLGALALLAMGTGPLLFQRATAGAGAFLSGGVVALAPFAYYARGLLKSLA